MFLDFVTIFLSAGSSAGSCSDFYSEEISSCDIYSAFYSSYFGKVAFSFGFYSIFYYF